MDIQKAKHLYLEMDKKNPSVDGTFMLFEKHDGWFGYMDLPSSTIMSRAHRVIPSLELLSRELQARVRGLPRGRLIFEIMIEGYEIDRFHELNGILNRKNEYAEGVYLRVHDFVPDFQFCNMPAAKRYEFAHEIVTRIQHPQVRMSPILALSSNPDEWHGIAEEMWQRGGEGLILKRSTALYSPKARNSDLMKIKEEVTVEMLATKVVEGTGDHEGIAGKLVCKDELGKLHEIGCGCSTHTMRRDWLVTPDSIVGQVVEIKAMKKLKDGSYREPRFKAIRYDKGIHELG